MSTDASSGDEDGVEATLPLAREGAPPTLREPAFGLPRIGDTVAGFYVVERPIGSGGMGHVLAARHTQFGQRVAVKILDPAHRGDRDALARFEREVKALNAFALESPHAVRVFDVGTLDCGLPYMVMELLDGRDLGAVLDERGPLPVDEACALIEQACEVVAEAHEVGIVHRDLKPRNLFLTYKDGQPWMRVVDFGIARAIGGAFGPQPSLTDAGDVIGTLSYMAPEQIRDASSVDPRSDIWSLGACLYKLLTNKTPFVTCREFGLVESIVTRPPTPIATHVTNVPFAIEAVILRCLEKDRDHRFATATELRVALVDARVAI